MADFNRLIPFLLYYETGGADGCREKAPDGTVRYNPERLPLELQFDQCRVRGFADVPLDRGGATLCGVTIHTFTLYRERHGQAHTTVEDLRQMEFAQWRDIAKSMFWDRWRGDKIHSQQLAELLVDWVWTSGITGIRIPQRLLGVTPDGIVGRTTLNALNSHDPAALFEAIKAHRLAFVKSIVVHHPSQRKFLHGWERRINAMNYGGLRYE